MIVIAKKFNDLFLSINIDKVWVFSIKRNFSPILPFIRIDKGN